jgi:asparagine synthase (glutamine-hydrolysing)
MTIDTPAFTRASLAPQTADPGQTAAELSAETLRLRARDNSGAFATGVRRTDGSVFLAVDRFGIDTLCYRRDGHAVHFDPRADAAAGSSAEIDPQALLDYFYFHAIPSPRTVFRGVARVPPAHAVEAGPQGVHAAPYWKPDFEPPRQPPNFDALAQEFRTLLRKACQTQLDGGPVACFLSGGTDSSTVAGMLAQIAGKGTPVDTFSIGFDAAGYDEMAYARLAAKHFGTRHHEYYVTPDDLVRSIPLVAAHYDQPFGNSSAVPAYHCALMAREHGVRRVLAGDGGDELFGGNKRYATQRVFGLYDHVPGALKTVLEPLLGSAPSKALPLVRKGSSYVEQARVPLPDRLQTYNLLARLGLDNVFTPAFLAQVDPADPLRQQRAVWQQSDGADRLNRQLAFDWRYTLAENDLPKVCGTTRLAGIEVAFPMLDRALVDFSLRLPVSYKLRGLRLRWFFKEALRGFLPDEIITKKKQGARLAGRLGGPWLRAAGLCEAVDRRAIAAAPGLLRRDGVDFDDAGAVAQTPRAELPYRGLRTFRPRSAKRLRAVATASRAVFGTGRRAVFGTGRRAVFCTGRRAAFGTGCQAAFGNTRRRSALARRSADSARDGPLNSSRPKVARPRPNSPRAQCASAKLLQPR